MTKQLIPSWLFTGQDVPRGLREFVSKPGFAALLAISALALGIASEILGTRTVDAISAAFSESRGAIAVDVSAFWLGVLFWGVAGYVRLIAEADDRRHLEHDILRSPNRQVFESYRNLYDDFHAIIAQCAENETDPEKVAPVLREAAIVIARLAQEFAPDRGHRYGVNIMLTIENDEDEFIDDASFHPDFRPMFMVPETKVPVQAILHMRPELLVRCTALPDDVTIRSIPIINLPVPGGQHPDDTVLPGAPAAYLLGTLNVFGDTRDLGEYVRPLDKRVAKSVLDYFSDNGPGADIRSLASVPIGRLPSMPGILNIDCSGRHLLGEEKFYQSFHVLATPMLAELAPLVTHYARLKFPDGLTGGPPRSVHT